MFFCLDTKEPKSQERNDIQHVSFTRLDWAFVLMIFHRLSLDGASKNHNHLLVIPVKTGNAKHSLRQKKNINRVICFYTYNLQPN